MGCEHSSDIIEQTNYRPSKTIRIDSRNKVTNENTIIESIEIIDEQFSESQKKIIEDVLRSHFTFSNLSLSAIKLAAQKFKKCVVKKSNYIFRQCEKGTCFFIIAQGTVHIEMNTKYIKTMSQKQSFGQLALLYTAPRSTSVKVVNNDAKLYFLHQQNFKQIINQINQESIEEAREIISKISIFNYLTNKQKYILLSNLIKVKYKKNHVIFSAEDQANAFFILIKGEIIIRIYKKQDIKIKQNQYFGEGALFGPRVRQGTAIASEDSECLSVSTNLVEQILGNSIQSIIYHNLQKWVLLRNPYFSSCDEQQVSRILDLFLVKYGAKYEVLRKNSQALENVYIPLDCKFNDSSQRRLFGIDFANEANDIVVTHEGNFAYANKKSVQDIVKNPSNFSSKSSKKLIHKQNISAELSIQNLFYESTLGQGQFGKVMLARDKKYGINFAVKKMSIAQIKSEELESAIIRQKEILQSLNSPFIQGFYKAQTDKHYIYFILEYIKGVELFDVIRQIGLIPPIICRYYLASMITALEYLHNENIIYRDLKPQNMMINNKGQLFLIDLGTAKSLENSNGYKTFTLIGTPHYMAPQIMQNQGYSLEVDYWSLGVIFYELIAGRLPFGNDIEDPYQVFRVIKTKKLAFPKFLTNKNAMTLIESLLNKSYKQRAKGGWEKIKKSNYFVDFNWNQFFNGNFQSPYIPRKFCKVARNSQLQQKRSQQIVFPCNRANLSDWNGTF